jgi:hypothetical protein
MNLGPTMSAEPDVPRDRNWSSTIKRVVSGFLVGAVVTSMPWLVHKLDDAALWPNFLLIPGVIVAVIFGGGNIHAFSLKVLFAANVIIYAALVYMILSVWKGRKRSD